MIFLLLFLAAAVLAGGVASLVGFGIGSILTPILAVQLGTKLAVAVVSIPHLAGTAFRFLLIRQHTDRRVLVRFGLASAAGGLVGALLHARFSAAALGVVLGVLLLFAGMAGLTGFASRMRVPARVAWLAGVLSGIFGGMVGNQGGIRSAALLGFSLDKTAFVATATAIALIVDAARMPVYFALEARQLAGCSVYLAIGTAGVLAGTMLGQRTLARIPERLFRRVVAGILVALGIGMLVQAV